MMPSGPMAKPEMPANNTPLPLSDIRPQQMGQLQAPRPIPRPDVPTLEGRMVAPGSYDAQRRDYLMQGAKRNPDGTLAEGKDGGIQFKRSGKDIALAALAGLGRGGILGAMTGALGATISPKFGREMNWEMYQKPRALEEEGRAMQQQMLDRQQALDALRIQRERVGLDQELAQTDLYKAQAKRALDPAIRPQAPRSVRLSPMQMPDGSTVLVDMNDPENAGKEFRAPMKPLSVNEARTAAEDERLSQEGDPEQIAEDSYQGRGGDQYVYSKLPAPIQQILSTGKANGMDATPEEIARAQQVYRTAIEQERKSILDYTKGAARKKTAQRAVGKRPGPASATGTRSLRELTGKYFGE